ncbi:N-6 DNA Methylase [uncultured archaeon]|nr:N-6 DNA Methylase [uncultured archaeon]
MADLSEKETRKELIDPILERTGWKVKGHYVKEEINPVKSNFSTKEYVGLDAVISMPSGIFKPYAGVSTAVLYFTKGEPTEKVWFYNMEADGFSLDDKRTEQPDRNDIPDILERFEKRNKEDNENRFEKHFFVPLEEIKEKDWDLSINRYKKEREKKTNYRESKIIIEEAKKEVKELLKGFDELEKLI